MTNAGLVLIADSLSHQAKLYLDPSCSVYFHCELDSLHAVDKQNSCNCIQGFAVTSMCVSIPPRHHALTVPDRHVVLQGVQVLHKCDLIHGDLTPRNCMVDLRHGPNNVHAVGVDLGSARTPSSSEALMKSPVLYNMLLFVLDMHTECKSAIIALRVNSKP